MALAFCPGLHLPVVMGKEREDTSKGTREADDPTSRDVG